MSDGGKVQQQVGSVRQFGTKATDPAARNISRTSFSNAKDRFRGNQASKDGRTTPEQKHSGAVSTQRASEKLRKLRVLIADDHPVVREGIMALINRRPDMEVVAEATNGREAVDKYFACQPDVALLDLRMSVMSGVDAAFSICDKDAKAHIVIITSYEREEEIYHALRAGALGYILKDAGVDELVDCIRTVGAGRGWIPPHVAGKLAKRVSDQELTRREGEVLHAVCEGKSNKEIGAAFDISEATVKVHMTHILEKLKVRSRTEAIHVAAKRGLVRLDEAPAA